jgi:acetyl esterase/lipase
MNSQIAIADDVSNDARLDPHVRSFLTALNKNSSAFWELAQPRPQEILTDLQDKTPVDMSGVAIAERTVTHGGRAVKIFVMSPNGLSAKPGVLLFIHGGVWIAGNFANHKRLLRDLVVGSGQVGVFVEYTPLPTARFPTQVEESYAVLTWLAEHADQVGADASRIAVVGNSVGGNMAAALTLMAKDRSGPRIRYQALLVPATDASVDSDSYLNYGQGRFLARAFMKYGWDQYIPNRSQRDNPYVSPLRATTAELSGLPPALVVTAENDPLRDEGEAYARKLEAAGVRVSAVRYNGTIHDFVLLNALREEQTTKDALAEISEGIRSHLGH